jgi:hypothetical protein
MITSFTSFGSTPEGECVGEKVKRWVVKWEKGGRGEGVK